MVTINFYPRGKGYFLTIFKLFVIVLFAAIFFTSCSVSKPSYIFKDITRDTVIKNFHEENTELKIQKNDVLNLSISSLNPLEDVLFNPSTGSSSSSSVAGKPDNSAGGGYLVNLDGNIYLHKLGTILVAGLTRKELKSKLEASLLPFLKDPIATVSFANHFVTVMGSVAVSQIVSMPAEKISLIDAIAQSGNVNVDGTLKNVLVIRESGGSKVFTHLNLENQSVFTSPLYYLQPKDIVVVNPNEDKLYKEQKRSRNLQLFSVALSAVSVLIIILDRIIK